MKQAIWKSLAASIVAILLSSCGVVELVNGDCIEIKKRSLEKREIGLAFLDNAQSGLIGGNQSISQVEADGYKFIIEGTELVVDNPQCFSDQEVEAANNLLGR
jgi:hypothetical protein